MLSQIPINLEKVDKDNLDREIMRVAVIAELDAVNLYEQMASLTGNENLKKVLLEVAREEKTHVGEFQAMLLKADKEQEREMAAGKAEVDELIEK
jgi:rubrerythrin